MEPLLELEQELELELELELKLELERDGLLVIRTRPRLGWDSQASTRPDLQPPPRPLISTNQSLSASNQPMTTEYTLGHIKPVRVTDHLGSSNKVMILISSAI